MKTLSLRGLSRDAPSLTEPVLVTHESTVIGTYYPTGTLRPTGPALIDASVEETSGPARRTYGSFGQLGLDDRVRPAMTMQGVVEESHMEDDVRVIDKFRVESASVVAPSTPQPRPFTPAPKPGKKK